jgi:predicted nucleic acid-binding Zn ribbon protein
MINSHISNLRLLRKKEKRNVPSFPDKSNPLRFKEASITEKHRWHERLRKDQKRDRIRLIILFSISIIIMLIILFWVIHIDYSGIIDVIN